MSTPTEQASTLLRGIIPPVYQADPPGLMRDLVDATAGMLAGPLDTIDQATDGTITDPAATPDTWLRWLATCLGVPQADTLTETRRLAVNRATATTVGTAPAIADLVRSYLTGTKSAIAMPTSGQPWVITIGVRADEAPDGLPALTDAIVATGQVPAGYTINVIALQATWADVDAAFPLWSDSDGLTWADRDSVGVLD